MKHIILTSVGIAGSAIASIFGGWTAAMTTLIIFMALDYISGLVVAGVFHNSTKTETGALESRAGLKGLCRKGAMLFFVLIASRLDLLLGAAYIKDTVCIAFILNELISIVENVGLMGIPIPKIITKAIDVLKKNDSEKGAGTITLDEFIKKYSGKAIDYDGTAGAQCVDLIKMYLKYVFGITPKAIGNAHAYFDSFNSYSFLKRNFIKIGNSKEFVPQKGDICVWSKQLNGYGHVSIATGKGNTSSFESFDMNWGGRSAKLVEHNYQHFLGVLRPIHREGIDGTKLFKVVKAVNVRTGTGTAFRRIEFAEFSPYEQEQVLRNGGKAEDNDFPAGMIVTGYREKGSWIKISDKKEMWISANLVEEL